MTLPPIFTPEYYAHWREFEATSWWNAAMRDVAGLLLQQVSLPSAGRLLDVGCGSGQGMRWFHGLYPEWSSVGIDPGDEGLRAARADGFRRVILGSATDLPLPDASVDLVICLDVLQHLPLDGGDAAALSEMRRVLRPGGYVYIRTNAQAFPHTPDDPEAQWHKYEPGELRAKLQRANLTVLRLSRINALLGLAEIPRELRRAHHGRHSSYDVVRQRPRAQRSWAWHVKRAWLRIEGRAVRAGLRLPTGRSIVALCRA